MKHILFIPASLLSIMLVGLIAYSGCTEHEPVNESEAVNQDQRILVFSATSGFRHDSIEPGQAAIKELANDNGFHVDISEDAGDFTNSNLSRYAAVVFLNTTGNVFNDDQKSAFKTYINEGGGFAGIHSATDTEHDWPWYNQLAGAWFDNHPEIQPAVIDVTDLSHPSTEMLPERWDRTDEWYNFRDFNENVTVLMKLDTSSFEGSDHPSDHPIAWYHEFDGGRSFYTALGHTKESYSEELFLQHIWGGIRFVTE